MPSLMALVRLIYQGFLENFGPPIFIHFYTFLHIFHIFWGLKLIVFKRGAPKAPPTHYPINFRPQKIWKYAKMCNLSNYEPEAFLRSSPTKFKSKYVQILCCKQSLYSSVVERQSCKLKVLGSIPSGGCLELEAITKIAPPKLKFFKFALWSII